MKFSSDLIPVPAHTMHLHSVSVARRLLSGGGRASLLAFREDPQTRFETVLHGVTSDGVFVVALNADGVTDFDDVIDVRLDIEKFAPDAGVVIRAATLHALGRMAWLDDDTAMRWAREGRLPDLMAELADVPGIRIAAVETPRVLLHDCTGVTPLDWAEIADPDAAPAFPEVMDEVSAADIACGVGDADWLEVIESVLIGQREGAELNRFDLPGTCPHMLGTVRVVDVDSLGVTVMHFTDAAATTLFVPFPARAHTLDELRENVGALRPVEWPAAM